jgi:hypothetical protein
MLGIIILIVIFLTGDTIITSLEKADKTTAFLTTLFW